MVTAGFLSAVLFGLMAHDTGTSLLMIKLYSKPKGFKPFAAVWGITPMSMI